MSYSTKHYGAGDPNCPYCKGLGYVSYTVPEDHPDFGKALDCQCRQAKVESERHSYLQRLGGLDILGDKTFESFNQEGVGLEQESRASLQRAYDICISYAANPQGWLILTGAYGCGKTHLAAAIANRQISEGNQALFITVPDLLDYLRAEYRAPDEIGEDSSNRFEQVRTISLLVLDDLGTESPTPWAVEKLYQILNYRYNAHLPTVITTNRDIEELEVRIRSRLFDPDLCQVLPIAAADYRRAGTGLQKGEIGNLGLYKMMTFDAFKPRRDLNREQRENARTVANIAKQFAEKPDGWLILLGAYGSGKTHLAAAIANWQRSKGKPVLFVTVTDLLDHLRATFGPNSAIRYDKLFNDIKTSPLLILDDLVIASATPWVKEKLHQIFNYRFIAKLPTVITLAIDLSSSVKTVEQEIAKRLTAEDQRLAIWMLDPRCSQIVALLTPAYLGDRQLDHNN